MSTLRAAPSPQKALNEAEQMLKAGRLDDASEALRRLLAVPALPGLVAAVAHNLLAIAALMRQDAVVATSHAQEASRLAPHDASLHFTLGRALKAAGELDAAVGAYRRAIALAPRFAEAHVSLGIALKLQGDFDGAIACHERAIAIAPQLAVAHANLGATRALRDQRGKTTDDAPDEVTIESQQRAVSLDPADPELQRNLGTVLMRAGRLHEAAHALNTALTLDRTDLGACLQLVRCLAALGDHALVREASEKWLALHEGQAEMMRVLANALTMLGESDAGLDWARRSLAIEPHPVTAMQLGNSLLQARRQAEGLAHCRQGVESSGRDVTLYPVLLMGLNYLHEEPAPLFAAHAELAARLPNPPRLPKRRLGRGDRLRVGYVSGDFVRHSVAFFMEPLLAHHDRGRFDITCFHNNPRSDRVTEQLKSHGHRWVECAALSDEALVRRVREEGIDVLIDLAGQTAQSRMLTFAQGAAPVQIGYLGYPTISGVPAIDWRITDGEIDPGDQPDFPSDRPLPLPRSMFCYRPPEAAPPVAPPPQARTGVVTFGSFNNTAKVTDHTLALWARAMRAVPRSRLLLKAASMGQASNRADIAAYMASQGITEDRLDLQGRRGDDREHLALYDAIDIALDTFPYNGATTSCEALWMGVPVVSLRGRTHASRMGASILAAAGQPQWVAADEDGFERIAVALSQDLAGRTRWRAGARAALRSSVLCDESGFTRAFEQVLMQTAGAA